MKRNSKIGWILLGLWLIIRGLIVILQFHITNLDILLAILAVAAGVLIIMDR
jgi:hypothetical protein